MKQRNALTAGPGPGQEWRRSLADVLTGLGITGEAGATVIIVVPPKAEPTPQQLQFLESAAVQFVDQLRANQIPGLLLMPAPTMSWYSAYRVWCRRHGKQSEPIKRFVSALRDQRGLLSETRHYKRSASGDRRQARFLLLGHEPPEGELQELWLGRCCTEFETAFQVYKGVVDA